jgi:hypothetical protein
MTSASGIRRVAPSSNCSPTIASSCAVCEPRRCSPSGPGIVASLALAAKAFAETGAV